MSDVWAEAQTYWRNNVAFALPSDPEDLAKLQEAWQKLVGNSFARQDVMRKRLEEFKRVFEAQRKDKTMLTILIWLLISLGTPPQ